MSDERPQTSLIGALILGGVPLIMGGAVLFFTSGVTFRCEALAGGHVVCTESRRLFRLVDMPIRRHVDVRGAVAEERSAYDEDGDPYTWSALVLLTGAGRTELGPSGAGGGVGGLVAQRVDDYAKHPTPEGLSISSQAGGLAFFFHLFSTIFVWSGLWTFGGYARHVFGRLRDSTGPGNGHSGPVE